ncbi:MAG: hypothetical protein D6797_09175, partial [Bdellovibrio sp.]
MKKSLLILTLIGVPLFLFQNCARKLSGELKSFSSKELPSSSSIQVNINTCDYTKDAQCLCAQLPPEGYIAAYIQREDGTPYMGTIHLNGSI